MSNTNDIRENLLNNIEEGLRENINIENIADNFSMSSTNLRRLFKAAFNLSIGRYIRSRKLSASKEDLLKTNLNVLDIAMIYGFEYEQSYIRSFKRKFGVTPGELRRMKVNYC
jgi:AraC family transcriptional regulator